eukprot:1160058-Pelagomonas_calceolata.AAC.15
MQLPIDRHIALYEDPLSRNKALNAIQRYKPTPIPTHLCAATAAAAAKRPHHNHHSSPVITPRAGLPTSTAHSSSSNSGRSGGAGTGAGVVGCAHVLAGTCVASGALVDELEAELCARARQRAELALLERRRWVWHDDLFAFANKMNADPAGCYVHRAGLSWCPNGVVSRHGTSSAAASTSSPAAHPAANNSKGGSAGAAAEKGQVRDHHTMTDEYKGAVCSPAARASHGAVMRGSACGRHVMHAKGYFTCSTKGRGCTSLAPAALGG